jgi:hypothetical protein
MKNIVRTPQKRLDKEKITNFETMTHINHVRKFMMKVVSELSNRLMIHDDSKMNEPELPIFMEFTHKLKDVEYNSPDYKKFLEDMKPALDHHYANNRHHPEHFKDGVNEMNLIDLLEMVADWQASVLRNSNGDVRKSIEINKERFGLSDQLVKILNNTVDFIEGK